MSPEFDPNRGVDLEAANRRLDAAGTPSVQQMTEQSDIAKGLSVTAIDRTDNEDLRNENIHTRDRRGLLANAKGKLAVGMAVLAGSAGLAHMETDRASAEGGATIVDENVSAKTTVHIAKSKSSSSSFAKAIVISNHRTVSKARVRQAKQAGNCRTISGKKAIRLGVVTQGYNGSGAGYAPENRRTTMCDINNDGRYDTRAECGNKLRVTRKPKPKLAKVTHWVSKKARVVIKAEARAYAQAKCETENTSAYAEALAHAKAVTRLRLKQVAKAKSKGDRIRLITKTRTSAEARAKAKARAEAVAICKESEGETPPPEQQNFPPEVDLVDHQHNITGREVEVCAQSSDPDNDIVHRQMTESGDGNFLTNIYSGNEPGEFCRRFAPGTSAGTAVVTAVVRDSKGNEARDTESWPIVKEPF